MTMQTTQVQALALQRFLDCFHSFAGFECKAKLAVNLSGTDKVMRVCIDTRLNSEHNASGLALLLTHLFQLVQFIDVVYNDSADLIIQCHLQFFGGLVVAVETNFAAVKSGLHRRVQFPAGNNVYAQAFFLHHPIDCLAGECLAGIAN